MVDRCFVVLDCTKLQNSEFKKRAFLLRINADLASIWLEEQRQEASENI
jgi:hypothetical protein